MIESPIVTEWRAEGMQMMLLRLLHDRFGPVPPDLETVLTGLMNPGRLMNLGSYLLRCPDLDSFRRQLAKEWQAEAMRDLILSLLEDRFGTVPPDIRTALTAILEPERLKPVNIFAARCPDLDSFRQWLTSEANGASASGFGQGRSA
jgi:hypothetical protein